MKNTSLRIAPLLSAALLSTGCASIFLSGHDDLKVVTEPHGAVARVGELSVVTPGVIEVPRDKRPVVVEIRKEGYEPAEVAIRRTRHGSVWTNAVGVIAGGALTAAGAAVCGLGGCEGSQYVPLALGAAATAGGLAIDLSTDRTLCLEKNEIAVVLKARAAEAAGGVQ